MKNGGRNGMKNGPVGLGMVWKMWIGTLLLLGSVWKMR